MGSSASLLAEGTDLSAHTKDELERFARPGDLDFADLDSELISRFLDHLETDRNNNTVASRNTRLAAIHSFFHFASYRHRPGRPASGRKSLADQ
jgi:site-specific recombinase XerD